MRGGDLAGQDDLQPGIERLGDEGRALEARIFQHQHAAFGLALGDEPRRLEQQRLQLSVAPQRRHARRAGRHRGAALPQWHEVEGIDRAREPRQIRIVAAARIHCRLLHGSGQRPAVLAHNCVDNNALLPAARMA